MNHVILKQSKRKMALDAFICDGVRTPIGKFGGALSSVRADDLAALPIAELMVRHPQVDWSQTDEVIYGDANQAGEDNRNVARMAALLAGLPQDVPGITVNRLCASGMDAVGFAARGIKSGDYELVIAGGVESMSRAPFVMPKAATAFSRNNAVYDTTIGWRFVNPKMDAAYATDSMPELPIMLPMIMGSAARIKTPLPCALKNAGRRRRRRVGLQMNCVLSASRSVGGIPLLLIPMNTHAPKQHWKVWENCAALMVQKNR